MFIAVAAYAVGLACGLVVSHHDSLADVHWGDVPTWLAFITAALVGIIALATLRNQQEQIRQEADRNRKRDQLMEAQLDESRQRAMAMLRFQAEQVAVTGYPVRKSERNGRPEEDDLPPTYVTTCQVHNGSAPPIRDVAPRLLIDGRLVMPSGISEGSRAGGSRSPHFWPAPERAVDPRAGLYRDLLAGVAIRARFNLGDTEVKNPGYMVRFTDDGGTRWQLDRSMHLERATDGDW